MPSLAAWLLTLVGPLVAKVLLALGFSVVTITGLDLVIGQIKAVLVSSATGMGADLLALFQIAGGGTALGIVLGAINTRIAIWTITKATRIIGSGS